MYTVYVSFNVPVNEPGVMEMTLRVRATDQVSAAVKATEMIKLLLDDQGVRDVERMSIRRS